MMKLVDGSPGGPSRTEVTPCIVTGFFILSIQTKPKKDDSHMIFIFHYHVKTKNSMILFLVFT